MAKYQIAMILEIEADSYAEAEAIALNCEENLKNTMRHSPHNASIELELNYDYDNYDQRVLYLHPEDKPEGI